MYLMILSLMFNYTFLMLIYNLFTPRYSWNAAKVCVKHQSINPLNIKEIDLSTLLYKMVYNRHHKEKPNFVDGQLIIQTSQIQRICITVDRYLSNFCKSFMHCSPWLFTTRNVEIYTVNEDSCWSLFRSWVDTIWLTI